jgi:hypothetical protein
VFHALILAPSLMVGWWVEVGWIGWHLLGRSLLADGFFVF